jgi:hypothetical protein
VDARKICEKLPTILTKTGYTHEFLFVVTNLSGLGVLPAPEIVMECIRTGMSTKQRYVREETSYLVSHFISLADSNTQKPILNELLNWSWEMVQSNNEYNHRHGLVNISKLTGKYDSVSEAIIDNGLLRNINLNVCMDRVIFRLFYFRIIKEVVRYCRQ